jgi:type I restriction enzyme R subunit
VIQTNFAQLQEHNEQLLRLGLLAERYFADDPNTCLLKLRQLAELLAQEVAARIGLEPAREETQLDLLRRLQTHGILPYEIAQLFHGVRKAGNDANHAIAGDSRTALSAMKMAWQIGVWFHRAFRNAHYKSGPFVPPQPPKDESTELKAELKRLDDALKEYRLAHQEASRQLEVTSVELQKAKDDQTFWEQMAAEAESARVALQRQFASTPMLAVAEAHANYQVINNLVESARKAAGHLHLDESETRLLIDQQLREAGWEVDTQNLRYERGSRPEPAKNRAIAEWPTESGRADYALFIGMDCVGVVEAKRRNKNVVGAIDQAKRYAADWIDENGVKPAARWSKFRVPFVFSTNGRAFQQQFKEVSGIWMCDLRRPQNLRKPLEGWYTPQGLKELLKQDIDVAEQKLNEIGFKFGFPLRDYQRKAIIAVEEAIKQGKQHGLVAMATGTGKTKTCIALVYRLLKAQRFRRILFLVDRSALGEQAANAFKETEMESLQRFSEVFGIKEIDEQRPDPETKVHIATVQGLVRRILYSEEALPVDAYDCIVVDECHRGYLLDREMSETEASFRDQQDYISKYRRVLDHFDSVKIGLTATPALHTTEIFGQPVFVYSYREAVLDGHLIDHDPALHINTRLAQDGIHWDRGEEVPVYNPATEQIDLFNTPDDLNFEVAEFNKKVITESFNRVVCETLTDFLSPVGPGKTLIFCATDRHADMVVRLLKDAFKAKGMEVDDDAITKITGAADKPLELIRRYRTEVNPIIAVTVDLLTTGIDVPQISNLVFLRRVNSRILYEQMLGRATRPCEEIDKEVFRIFDAVGIYESLDSINSMKPVVQNPSIGFAQLMKEITEHSGQPIAEQAKEQLRAKWQRKKRHLTETQQKALEAAGMSPADFDAWLNGQSVEAIAAWLVQNPLLGELLDQKRDMPANPVVISEHEDELIGVDPHFGKPEDYLQRFEHFIKEQGNRLPALMAVVQRPRELTRKDLLQLSAALEVAGFDERSLMSAWAKKTNHEIAARILGFVRQAAIGDALVPYGQRVDHAVQKLLASKPFTPVQQEWLKRLANQVKANMVLDEALINEGPFRLQGGFKRINQIFDGQLQELLAELNETIWQQEAS